jgi:DNA (cytosine-5)-methyltransferase 1
VPKSRKEQVSRMAITFIDLFSGVGGFRVGLEANGASCVFSSDIDKWANQTYFINFGEYPKGDIKKIKSEDIPDHDILCAGFPCQPFSIAGRRLGFADIRGTLFFEIERIIKDKKPRAFLLENVKGLINHDRGNTFATILNKLHGLGYSTFYKVLNSRDYGVPQNRERIYIVGFRDKVKNFEFPEPYAKRPNIKDILEPYVSGHELSEIALGHLNKHFKELVSEKRLDPKNPVIATEIRPSRCIFRYDGLSPCLTAKMGTGGNNVPVLAREKRTLTVRECLRIQGFPESFKIEGGSSHSYKQIGNSVSVPVIKAIAKNIIKVLGESRFDNNGEVTMTPTRTGSYNKGDLTRFL